ncbi:hypothetical protein G9A89_002022 [Geosiphon pyriformis]|nr:hypothetical protein G9A89_002022 [Geosiphon pyriformis]
MSQLKNSNTEYVEMEHKNDPLIDQIQLPESQKVHQRRRGTLAEMNNENFGWFHIRTSLIAGIGFFTDAYDLFAINIVSAMLGYIYFADKDNVVPNNIDLGLKSSAAIGTFIGQLLFGFLADHFGRKRIYGVELILIIIATIGSALAAESFAIRIYGTLIFWRFILGLGVGGDYPLSAVITSEYATTARRGAMMASVFAMQGFGILAGTIVSVVSLAIYKDDIRRDAMYIDYCWRLIIGLGIIPAIIALYFRLTISETPRYVMDVKGIVKQAEHERNPDVSVRPGEPPKSGFKEFCEYFGKWRNGKVLVGTTVAWFCVDIAYYGLGLNNAIILNAIGYSGGSNAYETLQRIALGNLIITVMGTVPGYWFTVFLIDSWGRKRIQILGFSILTLLFLILGFLYNIIISSSTVLFIILFTLSQFFQNFGPNTTTFIIPGEVFPTRYRSTCHGISAASGKLGAIVSQIGFSQLKDIGGPNEFMPHLLQLFAFFMLLGLLVTTFIPETKGRSLEELSNGNFAKEKDNC